MQESVKYVSMNFARPTTSQSVEINVPFVPTKYQVMAIADRYPTSHPYAGTDAVIVNADFVNGPIGYGATDQHIDYPIIKLQNWNNGLHNFWLSSISGGTYVYSTSAGPTELDNTIDVVIAFYP